MPWLIDSDWVIDHLNEDPTAQQLLRSLSEDGLFISVITYMEAFQGTLRNDPELALRLQSFVEGVPILPFNEPVAERCARIREAVRGGAVRPNRRAHDEMIAATAVENGLTLVTRNVEDYADIPELVLHRP